LNKNLERKVEHQDHEIGRLARLKQFLAPQVADLVVSEGKDSLLDTHRRYIACLFCDIRDFTAVSEGIEPEEVIAILQAYHEAVGSLVLQHQGTIGYRAGDGLMVFFNDPIPCEEPVLDAVRLALEIRAAFNRIREPWRRLGHPIGLGVAIASGYATLGLVGFQGRAYPAPRLDGA
jgi:class 3 adenylate cyclase